MQLPYELTAIDDPESFRAEARHQGRCAACGRPGAFDAHHVLEKRHCRLYGAPLHSPDNALRLCSKAADRCHERHTSRQRAVPLVVLRDENIAFAARWLGRAAAYEYLTRRYAGSDPRVDQLLEE